MKGLLLLGSLLMAFTIPATAAVQALPTPVPIELGKAFVLACCGESENASGLHQASNTTVKFVAVRSDSRCPYDIDCYWAGDAMVELSVNGRSTVLHTGLAPRSFNTSKYRLTLQRLMPERGAPGPVQVTLLLEAR
jgi:hypothetical protein